MLNQARPPYRLAAGIFVLVLAGCIATLAPTVTFWDAGEFITAARTLGIPHPPGTPLFVLLTNVWGRLIPFGAYAWRINLLSAVCSAAAASCWCLVVHDILERLHRDIEPRSRAQIAWLGGAAAALLVAFSYTTWQSATETEVYATAMLTSALAAWCVARRRALRTDARGARLLLAALLCGALSIGNHPLGLLIGPALVALAAVDAWRVPLGDAAQRRREWAQVAVVAAAWTACIGLALASPAIVIVAAALLLAAAGYAVRQHEAAFAAVAIVLVLAGASVVAWLWFRAGRQPWLNSGNPSTWHALLDVVRRNEYPPRTPLDDPTVMHGPGNPGRTLTLLAYQVANYVQYFDWQWASALGDLSRASLPRLAVTLLMATLGLRGAFAQWREDRGSFALVGGFFLFAGPALLLYLNFKPGPSIGWDRWLDLTSHEVRDRDYFFVGSFVAWGLWVAIGLAELVRAAVPRVTGRARTAVAALFAVALVPAALNFRDATRRQTAEATLARDFAHALLGSAPQGSVLFTNGDNDTFPLWYAQQVEGFRPDVTVICLSLAQAAWYIKEFAALHGLSDAAVDSLRPFRAPDALTFALGESGAMVIPSGGVVTPADVLTIDLLRRNAGRRPVAWSISAADELYGLAPHLVQRGLVLVLPVGPVDPGALVGGAAAAPGGSPLDLDATRRLVEGWSFGALETEGPASLDANIRAVTSTIAAPITQTGIGLAIRGDTSGAIRLLHRAVRLGDDSLARAMLARWGR
jgi:hypothetical protein